MGFPFLDWTPNSLDTNVLAGPPVGLRHGDHPGVDANEGVRRAMAAKLDSDVNIGKVSRPTSRHAVPLGRGGRTGMTLCRIAPSSIPRPADPAR